MNKKQTEIVLAKLWNIHDDARQIWEGKRGEIKLAKFIMHEAEAIRDMLKKKGKK